MDINRLIELTKRHAIIMEEKNIIVSVYTNASGFLWSFSMLDSGTDLGWSDHNGDCEMSGSFTSYNNAFADALDLIDMCDLDQFRKEIPFNQSHWGNYSDHLNKNYRK